MDMSVKICIRFVLNSPCTELSSAFKSIEALSLSTASMDELSTTLITSCFWSNRSLLMISENYT